MAVTEEVEYYQLYKTRSLFLHFYIAPFVLIYLTWLYIWTMVYGVTDYFEIGLIVFTIILILQILVCLFCLWSVHVRCLFTCSKVQSPHHATVVKVVPTPNNGYPELVKLHHSKNDESEEVIWFRFQKLKYIYESEEKKLFQPVDFPVNNSIGFYKNAKGYVEENDRIKHSTKYGKNRLEMNIPDFMELFKERATAPFFVFQVFCVGLWCLDEYWYYSVFTLFMLVAFEATLVQQQMRNMKEIRNMGSKPFQIQAYRDRKWRPILSEELLPGDICSIGRCQNQDMLVPCDLLLLRGSCIVDEAMLTGESVPQMKEAIEDVDDNDILDLDQHAKLHLLSGGTKVVQHSPPQKTLPGMKAPDNGCVAYVLRTGFNTSQGRLLRTILFGVKRITANNLETFLFILFLLIFAIAASSYVWIHGTADPRRNRYKLFLECTLILTSVVPPELPIELSLAVNSSLMALSKLGVFCTEPFRIPFAGKVDICCFDKTGTLTSDNLVVQGIAGIGDIEEEECSDISSVPNETIQVLASCHSLAYIDSNLVGDPLEKACLAAVDWTLTKGDIVMPRKGKKQSLRIVHRFHFQSSLKRMSTIASVQTPGSSTSTFMAFVKGAPETLREMYVSVPEHYDKLYQKMTCQGARVLALGYKVLGELQAKDVRELKRDLIEKDLVFAGFVIISCPLKSTSKNSIKEIQNASHYTVMITGDNPLTACHVAKQLKLSRKPLLVLTSSKETLEDEIWCWQSLDKTVSLPLVPKEGIKQLKKDYDLCVTGEIFPALQSKGDLDRMFTHLWSHIKVYARVAPKQKEYVITKLKHLGFITLMCGDGTNDVGALKHADVGVALLSGAPEESHKEKKLKKTVQNKEANDEVSIVPRNKVTSMPSTGRVSKAAKMRAMTRGESVTSAGKTEQEKKLQDMLKALDEMEETQVVRLGDASIASPFTSKHSSITSVCHIIKQGRCTLVTTLQMFKILALNALILAYSQSALYLDGIKFSDGQATLQGILLAGCFLFISRSKPLKTLSKERPLPNIFNLYTILTVLCQFAVHFYSLYFLTKKAKRWIPGRTDNYIDLDTKFEANIVNSTVYLISMAMQLSTFAVNYKGHPFMESLYENKPLLYSLSGAASAVVLLASGTFTDLCNQFEIVPMPDQHRVTILSVVCINFISCWIIDRILQFFLGNVKLKAT